MDRVTGFGGLFFKAENPEALYTWYEKHLVIKGGRLRTGMALPVEP